MPRNRALQAIEELVTAKERMVIAAAIDYVGPVGGADLPGAVEALLAARDLLARALPPQAQPAQPEPKA